MDVPKDVVALDVLQSHWNEGQEAALRRVLQMNAGAEENAEADSAARAPRPVATNRRQTAMALTTLPLMILGVGSACYASGLCKFGSRRATRVGL
jgi:hypothetical protein